jgi:hypothetical protein
MKPNIPEMSQAKLKKWIKACKTLLAYYEGKIDLEGCPLCRVATECGSCSWVWFTGLQCGEYGTRYYPGEQVGDMRENRTHSWVRNRKRQLKQWIAELERRLK